MPPNETCPDTVDVVSGGAGWRIAIDRGGTFTDIVAARGGTTRHAKVLSSGEDPMLAGIRQVLGIAGEEAVPCGLIEEVRLGTTVATNALLTRSGAKTALVVTEGLRDLPVIGDQTRPDLFALRIERPPPLAEVVIEASERMSVAGEVVQPLDEAPLRADLESARAAGCTSVAITLMHGWAFDAHERRVAEIAKQVGFDEIVTSSVSPVRGVLRRLETASLDAAVTPPLTRSIDRTLAALPRETPLRCMQSGGGLTPSAHFRGCRAVLSGPVGGLIAAAHEAEARGIAGVVAFDMGGTSTDVSWYGGCFERDVNAIVGGVRVAVPMLRVHTIAAGGGSVCDVRGGRLRVGPASAGAEPGPACYGRGGPATISDCHAALGRLPVGELPSVFGAGGDAPLDAAAASAALEPLAREAGMEEAELAEGLIDVAVESIAAAIREISVAQGHDLAAAALVAFGGAGGQVACRVAARLDMKTVIMPPRAGVFSAVGIGAAAQRAVRRRDVGCLLAESASREPIIAELAAEAQASLEGTGAIERMALAGVRAAGWDREIQVPWGDSADMDELFLGACRRRFGFVPRGERVLASIEVEVELQSGEEAMDGGECGVEEAETSARMHMGGVWQDVPVRRGGVGVVEGPAILIQDGATTVLEQGWRAEIELGGGAVLTRARDATLSPCGEGPVAIEVANRRFQSICREMGIVLQHTAVSVNVKERRDYSCAVFDASGRLVANGPHMPVHLGSMGESVRRVLDVHGDGLRAGDAYLDNDPAHGGTHLPDLTVVTPVLSDGRTRFIVASRAHHADIGGVTPGSMPANSTRIEEEGVVFDAFPLVQSGLLQEDALRAALAGVPWPARNPDLNIEDLRAQLAANARGVSLLEEMDAALGGRLEAAMDAVRANAAACVREMIEGLPVGEAACRMDGGEVVRVRVRPKGGRLLIDFGGTTGQVPSNLNAPRAVTQAAVLYVLRCLVADDIPLNEGCMEPVDLRVPAGSLLDPEPDAAVVAGNVETSQAVVDALLASMGAQAGSQGTMNNLTFGDAARQYYETICGGAGAGPGFDGASGVHTHMTNSMLTDPEVLESRYPVRVVEFALRHGSGGMGQWRGGDGVRRALRFLEPMHVSLLAGRRTVAPAGLAGGGDALPGRQWIERLSGVCEPVEGRAQFDVGAGDRLVIETPGGAGAHTSTRRVV